jgi:hypothetical protein
MYLDVFAKIFFVNFDCKCEKNYTFSNILQIAKIYLFANIYHSPFDLYDFY